MNDTRTIRRYLAERTPNGLIMIDDRRSKTWGVYLANGQHSHGSCDTLTPDVVLALVVK